MIDDTIVLTATNAARELKEYKKKIKKLEKALEEEDHEKVMKYTAEAYKIMTAYTDYLEEIINIKQGERK